MRLFSQGAGPGAGPSLFAYIRMKTSKVFSCLKIRLSPPSSSEDRRSRPPGSPRLLVGPPA
jgi:hypothetical protein